MRKTNRNEVVANISMNSSVLLEQWTRRRGSIVRIDATRSNGSLFMPSMKSKAKARPNRPIAAIVSTFRRSDGSSLSRNQIMNTPNAAKTGPRSSCQV